MAQTGRTGGRQSLENTRVQGDVHSAPPSVGNAKSKSMEANVATHKAPISNNRKHRGLL